MVRFSRDTGYTLLDQPPARPHNPSLVRTIAVLDVEADRSGKVCSHGLLKQQQCQGCPTTEASTAMSSAVTSSGILGRRMKG